MVIFSILNLTRRDTSLIDTISYTTWFISADIECSLSSLRGDDVGLCQLSDSTKLVSGMIVVDKLNHRTLIANTLIN